MLVDVFARTFSVAAGMSVAVAALVTAAVPADAGPSRRGEPRVVQITAESLHGHGEARGLVREGPSGRLQVQTPGGTWFDCAHSCADTLRKETVDFWEAKSGRTSNDGVGILRFGW